MPLLKLLLLGLALLPSFPQSDELKKKILATYQTRIDSVFTFRNQVRALHPILGKVYPVALVEEKTIFVFEPDEASGKYRLATTVADPYGLPRGVRAAMPLGFWDNRTACVVSGEIFDEPAGYVMIFHEFVHCAQAEICEQKIKGTLESWQDAMRKKDYMWELQYPFPYGGADFAKDYSALLKALEDPSSTGVDALRSRLHASLTRPQWEYLTWQEWKEGFARFLENSMRNQQGLPRNDGGSKPPYDRVSFYYGGDRMIGHLTRGNKALLADIEQLYAQLAR
jgi:hypothetical protein